MDENEDLNLDENKVQDGEGIKNKNRYKELSEKVIQEKAEKETLAKAKEKSDKKIDELAKEVSFYKDFSSNVSKYPQASGYQDQILEKVKSGYSTEDAMVAVLAKEGKLSMSAQPQVQMSHQVEGGGSAPTSFDGAKSIQDMTVAEKFAALTEADKTGDLSRALRGGR